MPKATHHQSQQTTKLLNLARPGAGKTGALACLVKAGYRLIIVDFDNGLDILIEVLKDDPKALDRLYFETFTDKLQAITGMVSAGKGKTVKITQIVTKGAPTAWTDAMLGLTRWKFPDGEGGEYDLGNISEWGTDTVVVIDSLGLAGVAAFRFFRQLAGHQLDLHPDRGDYGKAMDALEGMLQLLYSDAVKCHVIVNTHFTLVKDEATGMTTGLPRALGSKLPPHVGGYFNTIIGTEAQGTGSAVRRIINTQPQGLVEMKIPLLPKVLPATLPIETGLLTIFKTLQSRLEKGEKDA